MTISASEFNEFAKATADAMESIRAESKALKQQLKAIDGAEEMLAKLTIATDSAQSLHSVMMTEKKQMAEQSLVHRKEFTAEVEQAFTRLENSKNLAKSQMQLTYDAKAEADAAREEVRNLHNEVMSTGDSLLKKHDWALNNVDLKIGELDRKAGNQYIDELFERKQQNRDGAFISNEIQRQLRMMNPSAYIEAEETTEG